MQVFLVRMFQVEGTARIKTLKWEGAWNFEDKKQRRPVWLELIGQEGEERTWSWGGRCKCCGNICQCNRFKFYFFGTFWNFFVPKYFWSVVGWICRCRTCGYRESTMVIDTYIVFIHIRLQSMGSWSVRHDWATSLLLFTFMHWRRKWQPTPVFLPGESQGWQSLVGCHLWGRTESDTTEVT